MSEPTKCPNCQQQVDENLSLKHCPRCGDQLDQVDEEPELFSSLKNLPGGENDNKGKAAFAGIATALVGVLFIAALGIKSGIVSVIPFLIGWFVYKEVMKK